MITVKRQRTESPEEEHHRQNQLEDALALIAELRKELHGRDVENHALKMEMEALRREAVPYARQLIEAREEYIKSQDAKMEELCIENKVLTREKSKAQSEVKRQIDSTMNLMEENNAMKEELELKSYQIVQLKRDAECYSRYFAQVDDEYEGLRAQIRELESAQQVAPQERMEDNEDIEDDEDDVESDEDEDIEDTEDDQGVEDDHDIEDDQGDQEAKDEFGDHFDFGDDGPLSSDETDEFYDASEEPMDEAEEEYENRQ